MGVYVYRHTCPNGKVYIGVAENCEKRWKNGDGYKNNPAFYNDILSFGWDNIAHDILADCPNRLVAESVERHFITLLGTEKRSQGYNRTKYSKETKSKRLNLLVFPSVYKACKEESDRTGESVNEIINEILLNYFTKESCF